MAVDLPLNLEFILPQTFKTKWKNTIIMSYEFLITEKKPNPLSLYPTQRAKNIINKLSKYYEIIIIYERNTFLMDILFPNKKIILFGEFGGIYRLNGIWKSANINDLESHLKKVQEKLTTDLGRCFKLQKNITSFSIYHLFGQKKFYSALSIIKKVLSPIEAQLHISERVIDVLFAENLKDKVLEVFNVTNVLYCIGGSKTDYNLFVECNKLNPNSTINIGKVLRANTTASFFARDADQVMDLLEQLFEKRNKEEYNNSMGMIGDFGTFEDENYFFEE